MPKNDRKKVMPMAEGVLCSADNPCAAMQVLAERSKTQGEDIKTLFKLSTRLPLWATALIAGMSTTIGILATKLS